jgi:hypothetical protein
MEVVVDHMVLRVLACCCIPASGQVSHSLAQARRLDAMRSTLCPFAVQHIDASRSAAESTLAACNEPHDNTIQHAVKNSGVRRHGYI